MRTISRQFEYLVNDVMKPKTGLEVKLVNTNDSSASDYVDAVYYGGAYTATWTEKPIWGRWYVNGEARNDIPLVWMGNEKNLKPVFIFKDIPFDIEEEEIAFTTGTDPLDEDVNGNAPPLFYTAPICSIINAGQDRNLRVKTVTLNGDNTVTITVALSNAGEETETVTFDLQLTFGE